MSLKRIKLVFYGKMSVGKTRLSSYITSQQNVFIDKGPTIGIEYSSKFDYNNNTKVIVWDLSGDPKFNTLYNEYFKIADIILYVYDISNHNDISFLDMVIFLEKYQHKNVYVIGNKIDLVESVDHLQSIIDFTNEKCIPHFLVSAKDKTNISCLLENIVDPSARICDPLISRYTQPVIDNTCCLCAIS